MSYKEKIAKRAAREVSPEQVINLGIGIPTLIPVKISMASVQGCRRLGVGFSFFQYSSTLTLHKYIEQSRIIESPLLGGKPKPVQLHAARRPGIRG